MYYTFAWEPNWVILPVGGFADPDFPPPIRAIHEERRHAWDTIRERE